MSERALELETRLRALGQTEYALERVILAKEYKVAADKLDGIYRSVRAEKPEKPEPAKWPDEVDGNGLLSAIVCQIGKYIFAEPADRLAIALWALHAHAHEASDVSPILLISSPVKGCGKSTLLDILELLTPRPLLSANCSSAALYRSTENRPTILVDEADLYFSDDRSLVAFFNAGHRRGCSFTRCEGDDHHVVTFDSWAPKALAQIGMPRHPTIVDRAIVIRLRRKMAHETVEKFRRSRVHPDLEDLRMMAARWAEDHLEDLRNVNATLPDTMDNRLADNWEPLFVIAHQIGGEWTAQLNLAVKTLAHEDEDRRIELLGDLHAICTATEADFLPTAEILEKLLALTERPYQEINNHKAINGHWLARQLKAFGLTSDRWRPPGTTNGSGAQIRGYHVKPILQVGCRYLPSTVWNVTSVTEDAETNPGANSGRIQELKCDAVTSETDRGSGGDPYTEIKEEVPF